MTDAASGPAKATAYQRRPSSSRAISGITVETARASNAKRKEREKTPTVVRP
ncbi:hypothetical protein [Nocardioides alcanivorans]|uniref:hypothetical protein n=1 Tax=Nocardioides alcanivorans TaxID=2897352 RepID=UPI001F4550EB|nr:hypothetical protein [Nocardioides alcanivorans]